MNWKFSIGLTIILLVATITVFVVLKTTGFEVAPVISESINHEVDAKSLASLEESLATIEKNIIGLRAPKTTSWLPGETGSFALGIKNKNDVATELFITIIPQKPVNTPQDWLIYPQKKTLPPREIEIMKIITKPVNPSPGTYTFRVIACKTHECYDTSSHEIYATTTFSFKII